MCIYIYIHIYIYIYIYICRTCCESIYIYFQACRSQPDTSLQQRVANPAFYLRMYLLERLDTGLSLHVLGMFEKAPELLLVLPPPVVTLLSCRVGVARTRSCLSWTLFACLDMFCFPICVAAISLSSETPTLHFFARNPAASDRDSSQDHVSAWSTSFTCYCGPSRGRPAMNSMWLAGPGFQRFAKGTEGKPAMEVVFFSSLPPLSRQALLGLD